MCDFVCVLCGLLTFWAFVNMGFYGDKLVGFRYLELFFGWAFFFVGFHLCGLLTAYFFFCESFRLCGLLFA